MADSTHQVEVGREVRVHQFEEEVAEWTDLSPAGHVDTLGSQRHHQREVGVGEGEHGQREGLLNTAGGGITLERTITNVPILEEQILCLSVEKI